MNAAEINMIDGSEINMIDELGEAVLPFLDGFASRHDAEAAIAEILAWGPRIWDFKTKDGSWFQIRVSRVSPPDPAA